MGSGELCGQNEIVHEDIDSSKGTLKGAATADGEGRDRGW